MTPNGLEPNCQQTGCPRLAQLGSEIAPRQIGCPIHAQNGWKCALLAAALFLFLPAVVTAQTTSTTEAQTETISVAGVVLDAVSDQPVPRALVQLGDRATLAGADGKFAFHDADPRFLTVSATKPGYTPKGSFNDPDSTTLTPTQLSEPITLRLYPEGIVRGIATSQTGEPIPNLQLSLLRYNPEGAAGVRWLNSAFTRTNSRGEFRFSVPAGDIRLQSMFTRLPGTGGAAIPAIVPQPAPTIAASSLHLTAGGQLSLDIHPTIAPLIDVLLRDDAPGAARFTSIQAISPDAPPFLVPIRPGPNGFDRITGMAGLPDAPQNAGAESAPRDVHVDLPVGTWTLRARRSRSDDLEQATVTVNVGQTRSQVITLRTLPLAPIPIEIVADTSTANGTTAAQQAAPPAPPQARSLALMLEPTGATALTDPAPVRPMQRDDGTDAFLAPPGTYRLRAQSAYFWFIRAATSGSTDLLSHDLTVAPGAAAGTPITLTVSDALAGVSGTVALRGQPAALSVVAVATFPTGASVITTRSSSDGVLRPLKLPPGTWRIAAFEHQPAVDFSEPGALDRWSTRVATVTADPGQPATVTLDAIPDAELPQ